MWAVCDLFASVPSYYDNTRCGGARRIRVLSESAHVIMCVPHARVRTCDFVHIRMRECACMIMCVPHMRNVLYETALRALRERPAGRFASRGCAHQGRMRAYVVFNSWYQQWQSHRSSVGAHAGFMRTFLCCRSGFHAHVSHSWTRGCAHQRRMRAYV